MITAYLGNTPRTSLWDGPVIDCDVHAVIPSLDALTPHLPRVWVQTAKERGWTGPSSPQLSYPPGAPTTTRAEWASPGRPAATSAGLLREHILDPWGVERAIVNCYYGVDSLRHPDWAAALASAVNDWLVAEWLDRDPRLRASLVIPARDPAAAVQEIDRVGGHPGFVQVMLPVRAERLYGQRIFHPLFDAIVRHDLVAGLHWGGTSEDAPSPAGYASWYVEEYVVEQQLFGAQLTSLIWEGTFRRFPTLRVAMMESGFAWLPMWGWTMNKKWKGLRREIPWVDRLPLDIVRDHFRFSTAPADLGPHEHAAKIIRWLGSTDLLMFATDYPHLHTDDLTALLALLPEPMRRNTMSETARAWYRL